MYVPKPPPFNPDAASLAAWLANEAQGIAQAQHDTRDNVEFNVLHAAPSKPRAGMVATADGTDWNPGGGAGAYQYIGGVWVKQSPTNLTGEVTTVGSAATLTNSAVIAKVLTGYSSGAGTVAATDSILSAIQKLNGNDATNANLTGDVTSVGNATTIGAGKVTDSMLVQTSAATSATTGTMTVNMTSDLITITPSGACTFNASGGRLGRSITFVVTTSGVSSFVLTFGTNFKSTATLATGTTTAKTFAVTFICTNGTQWVETARTTAM